MLAQCPKTLEKLGTEALDVYNIPSRHWVQVDASWPHSVSTDTYLLFRCRNVKCLDFDKELAAITRKNTHLRTNMPGDWSSVRVLRKRKATLTPSPQSSPPSEVQVLDLTITPKASAQKRHLPSLTPLTIPVVTIPDSPITSSTSPSSLWTSSVSQGPSSSSSFALTSPSSPPVPSSPSSIPSPNLTSSHKSSSKWPAHCYVVDMQDAFEKIDSREMRKRFGTLEERLEHVFGCKVKLATYYNARTRWKAASEDHREEAVAGGRTPAGRWSVFARQYPLKQ
jgi:hypothetical protein